MREQKDMNRSLKPPVRRRPVIQHALRFTSFGSGQMEPRDVLPSRAPLLHKHPQTRCDGTLGQLEVAHVGLCQGHRCQQRDIVPVRQPSASSPFMSARSFCSSRTKVVAKANTV